VCVCVCVCVCAVRACVHVCVWLHGRSEPELDDQERERLCDKLGRDGYTRRGTELARKTCAVEVGSRKGCQRTASTRATSPSCNRNVLAELD